MPRGVSWRLPRAQLRRLRRLQNARVRVLSEQRTGRRVLPVRWREQLQLPVGGAALLRPDLYLAGVVPVDDTAIEAALCRMFSGGRG